MSSSTPPSRGSAKTYGKHEVPMVNVEENGTRKDETTAAGAREEERPKEPVPTRQMNRTPQPIGDMPSSSLSNTTASKRALLPPSHIKLPAPPSAGPLNGSNPIHKSASSASLYNNKANGDDGTTKQEDASKLGRTVPNMAQMIVAAREREMAMASLGKAKGGGTRLPPLQLPKVPNREGQHPKDTSKADPITREMAEKSEGRTPQHIATVADRPMPQLRHVTPTKTDAFPAVSWPLPPPYSPTGDDDPLDRTSASMPPRLPRPHIPNEVPALQHPTRRRPSSAGAVPSAGAHKPLPAISEPNVAGISTKKSRVGATVTVTANKLVLGVRRSRWRIGLRCAVIGGLLLGIPALVFLLMMLSSDGFSASSSKSDALAQNQTTASPVSATTPTAPVPTTTVLNIVGGAIFQPISMQNETGGAVR